MIIESKSLELFCPGEAASDLACTEAEALDFVLILGFTAEEALDLDRPDEDALDLVCAEEETLGLVCPKEETENRSMKKIKK